MNIGQLREKLERELRQREQFRKQAEQTLAAYAGRIQMLEEMIAELEETQAVEAPKASSNGKGGERAKVEKAAAGG